MSRVGEVLSALAEAFAETGTAWYLFGAQAVSARAAPRATQDVDVTARVPRTALAGLIRLLEARGFEHRFPDIADELMASGAVLPLVHVPSGMDVDLVLAGSGLEDHVLANATPVPIEGVAVPVASATDLVVLKILAGRGKDLEDAAALLATGDVDVAGARSLLSELEQALAQSDLVPRLDALTRA